MAPFHHTENIQVIAHFTWDSVISTVISRVIVVHIAFWYHFMNFMRIYLLFIQKWTNGAHKKCNDMSIQSMSIRKCFTISGAKCTHWLWGWFHWCFVCETCHLEQLWSTQRKKLVTLYIMLKALLLIIVSNEISPFVIVYSFLYTLYYCLLKK